MKTMWNAISFLAVVHLLALLMLVGWLWQTGRLDRQRISDLRQFLSQTTTEAQAAAQTSLAEAEVQRLRTAQEQSAARPPTDSETQVQRLTLISQQEEQTRRRLADERQMLQAQLDRGTTQANEQKAAFEQQRLDWEQSVKTERQQRVDVQHQQAVKLFEQAPPKQAKKMLQELIDRQQVDQAVEYLDAMNVRAASKVLKEFKTDEEIKVATELLEKLRTLGQPAAGVAASQGPNHAADTPTAVSNSAVPAGAAP